MALDKNAKQLQQTLEELFSHQADDQRLRDHLEGVRRNDAFSGLTWFWGPQLYKRNRAVFRPLILEHFSEWYVSPKGRWTRISWSEHSDALESWLVMAREARDSRLVRRLLRWRFAGRGWEIDHAAWNVAMLAAYRQAPSPAARAIVLNEFDDWFKLDEPTALGLYETDRESATFILRHVPQGYLGSEKRKPWPRLAEAAFRNGDEDFAFALYRKLTPIKTWQADITALARSVTDTARLNDELDRRHLTGYGLNLQDGIVTLLEARGRDVMPYIRRKLKEVLGAWYRSKPDAIIELAGRKGWWDLWSAAIRASGNKEIFNRAVTSLLADRALPEKDRIDRLAALAGVSREWNWPGFGLAQIVGLEDECAVVLYQRYPELIRGPFKPNITPTWWQGCPKLLKAAQDAGDDELVDLLASRYVTRVHFDYAWNRKECDVIADTANGLGRYYEAIRDRNPSDFARRAANVLTRIPAYSIYSFRQLLETNQLARLLFVRSFDAFLDEPRSVQDLVEGSDIHVQQLAYRILAQDDRRARALGVANLDILLGTLLRPLHRKTRLPAFDALANAARTDADAARRILDRARKALRLPDKKYPKEQLVGLLGLVLHARPELRSQAEQPVVYGLEPEKEVVT
ncbi:MAG: gliding motility protein [Planctomycetes bacterium]|nr:gliding motility protein [Planctomycetota bacterium]